MPKQSKANLTSSRSAVRSQSDHTLWICLGLVFGLALLYGQTLRFDFVDWDDPPRVIDNSYVRGGLTWTGIHWAFTTTEHAPYWCPITWLTHMIDCELYGIAPAGHHATNVLIHLANTLLLFGLFRTMTHRTWPSALVAALFALHPLHVESVAWISARPGRVSALFGLGALYVYVRYTRRPGTWRYLLTAALTVLSLMSKPDLIILPVLMLLLDYWPLERWRRDDSDAKTRKWRALFIEKIPFFAFSAIASLGVMWVEDPISPGAASSSHSLPSRLANAVCTYAWYIGKAFWPTNHAVTYPHTNLPGSITWTNWQILISSAVLLAITLWIARRGSKRYPIVGWLWYLGTLVPVIGIVKGATQALSDRYTYLPFVGLYIIIAWGTADLMQRWPRRRLVATGTWIVALVALMTAAWFQVRTWRNSLALFDHAISVNNASYLAYTRRGVAYELSGDFRRALDDFNQAIELKPCYVITYFNRGKVRSKSGRHDLALADYTKAIELKPDYAEAHNNRGNVHIRLGSYGLALADYATAIELKPDFVKAYANRGIAFAIQGRYKPASNDFTKAIALEPDSAETYHNRGNVYTKLGDYELALADFNRTIQLKPNFAKAYHNRGLLYRQLGEHELAQADFNRAIELKPN